MSIIPNEAAQGMRSVRRTLLFWVLMLAIAAVLWQMASRDARNRMPVNSMSYSDFMGNVDRNNVATAKLYLSQSTAEMQGTLRQPPQAFVVTVPKEVIPDLTERLRKQGVSIEVAEKRHSNSTDLLTLLLPFTVFLVALILRMRWRRDQQRPPAGTQPSSGPIGD